MHIFLTGGTGCIGGAVMAQAVADGHKVTALVRSADAKATVETIGATPILGDLNHPDVWMPNAVHADSFIHLASSFDDAMHRTEPRLTASLATHVRTRKTPLRFLYTGGCWMYGRTGSAVADETSPMRPIAAFEWAGQAITDLPKGPMLSCAVVHPAMVYHEQGGVFSRMITALRGHRPVPVWGSEHTRWPLIHRGDAARAYIRLAQTPNATGHFNLVAEQGVPVGVIADALSKQAGVKTPPAVLPSKWVLSRHGMWAEGPMLDQQMRSSRMADLGWIPEYHDFSALTYRF